MNTNEGLRFPEIYITFLILVTLLCQAEGNSPQSDSVGAVKSKPTSHIKSLARLHTKGMFTYGGRISSDNPAFDINLTYERKNWGLLIYKAIDLQDHTTANNFGLAVINKNFKLGKRFTFTPNIGVLFEQAYSVADRGTDVAVITLTSYKINSNLSMDHTALFGNLIIDPEFRDWVNRFRFLYTTKHVDMTYMLWHNNHIFDEFEYVSTGLTIAYNRIRLSDQFFLGTSVTGISMLESSDQQSNPKISRLVFTINCQFVN